MATTEEIKKTAILVRDATQIGENTAERVGGVLVDLANKSKELEDNIGKKANKADMDVELGKKFDKESVVQESGDSDELVMSQKAVSAKLSDLDKKLNRNLLAIEFDDETGDLNAIIGQDSTISSVSTDEDGNVIIEQEIS